MEWGGGWQFLGKVDFEQVPRLSESLLRVVEGNLIGHIGKEAGRGQVTDKTKAVRAGLGLAAFTRKITRKCCQNVDTKPKKR